MKRGDKLRCVCGAGSGGYRNIGIKNCQIHGFTLIITSRSFNQLIGCFAALFEHGVVISLTGSGFYWAYVSARGHS